MKVTNTRKRSKEKTQKKQMLKVAGVLIPNRDFLQILDVWYGTASFNLHLSYNIHDTPGLVPPTKKGILETLV